MGYFCTFFDHIILDNYSDKISHFFFILVLYNQGQIFCANSRKLEGLKAEQHEAQK